MSEKTKFIKGVVFQSIILLFLLGIVPLMIGLGGKGFDTEEIIRLFNTYAIFGVVGVFIIVLAGLYEYFVVKDDSKYGNSIVYSSPGDKISIPLFKYFKGRTSVLLFGSLFFFSLLAIILNFTNQSFTGEVLINQQFTPIGELLFRLFLIPISENAIVHAVFVLFLVIGRTFARKYNIDKNVFLILFILFAVIIFGTTWTINHNLRYGDTDLKLIIVGGFGAVGGLLTIMTGSFIPFLIMHFTNNLFYDLNTTFSSDIALIVPYVLVILFGLLTFWRIIATRNKKEALN